MISTVLIVTAVFLYYLYFQRRYRYWERRGECKVFYANLSHEYD